MRKKSFCCVVRLNFLICNRVDGVLMNIGAKTLATAMEVSSGGSMRPRGVKFDRISLANAETTVHF